MHQRGWGWLILIGFLAVGARADDKFKFAPHERPPRAAKRINVGDEYQLKSKFYEPLDDTTWELSQTPPEKLAEAEVQQKFRKKVEQMEAALDGVHDKKHPDWLWCREWLDAWKQKLESVLAGGAGAASERAAASAEAASKATFQFVRGERPPKADPAIASGDRVALDELYAEVDRWTTELERSTPEQMVNRTARLARGGIERMRAALQRVNDKGHPDWAWCQAWVDKFEAHLGELEAQAKQAVEAAAAAAAQERADVDGRLSTLSAYFDPKTFQTHLEPPITAERTQEWLENLRQWSAMGQKGLKELDELAKTHPKYAKDQRLINLRRWFGKELDKRIQVGIARTIDWYDVSYGRIPGLAMARIQQVEPLLDPQELDKVDFGDDQAVQKLLTNAREAVEGAELRATFARDYLGKPEPKDEQLLAKLRALLATVETRAQATFANARLPAAPTQDPELLEVAKRVLGEEKGEFAPGEWKRMVINAPKQHYQTRRSSSTIEGDYIVIRSWNEEWDEFQVCLAEKVDQDWRLVYYSFRYYTVALSGLNHWYCSARWVRNRIPEANIAK